MKIRTKLLISFVLVALISGVLGLYSIRNMKKMDAADKNLYQSVAVSLAIGTDIVRDFQRIRSFVRDAYIANNLKELSIYLENIEKLDKSFEESLTKYQGSISDEVDKRNYENLKQLKKEYLAFYPEFKQMLMERDQASALKHMRGDWKTKGEELQRAIDQLTSYNLETGKKLSESNHLAANQATTSTMIMIVIAIALAIILGLFIASNIQKIIQSVISQTKNLVDAALDGKLTTRANTEDTNEEFRGIILGINQTLDAVITPLNIAASYVEQISKGEIPEKISDDYNGDFNSIKINLNQCIDAINLMVADANLLSNAAVEGKLTTRVDASKHSGDFRKIIEGVNDTLDTLVGLLDAMPAPAMIVDTEFTVQYMNVYGAGAGNKTPQEVTGMKCYDHFKTEDCKTSNCACSKTMLSSKMEKSETTARPSEVYEIEYSAIPLKNKTGKVIGAFEVISDQTSVKKAMKRAAKLGYYQTNEAMKLTENLNKLACGDLSIELHTEVADEDTRDAKSMFDDINHSVNTSVAAIKQLVGDANILANAAVEGQLSTRANADKHQGEFRKIVEGVNNTLDAVIGPLNVAALYVDKIAKGDMPEIITENYNGDFNAIKNNLNSLIKSFNEIITKAKMVSQGDLTVTLAKRSENDELMGALSEMVTRLSDIVSQVMEAAQNVATSSNEMSTSAVQISEGASEQSASAEEVSSSIEEMSSTIQQNSDNSLATQQIAVASAQGMTEVNEASQKSLEAMRKISEKIKIINDIAGKTDILAINAAIEAARAGEQGKGFAVVAAEVRKLAEVSQRAAVEINELSASSLRVTNEAGSLMMKIIPEIQKTAQLVKEIAASSNEQRLGSEQITKAVIQFTQVTQQNAAAAEEMSSSSEELASQAELLKETIGFFNTGRQIKASQPVKHEHKSILKSRGHLTKPSKDHASGVNIKLENSDTDDKKYESF